MGSGETVDWQAERIGSVLKQLGLNEAGEDPDADGLRALVEAGDAAARFAVRPTDLPAVIRGLDALPGTVLRAQMNVGVLDVRIADSANAKSVIYALNALMPPGGYLTWTRLPESWRPMIDDVWGRPRGDFHLMRSIKQALDPDSRFSPGRFIGGL
jgi:glycolate oxidase FAD binding subunit